MAGPLLNTHPPGELPAAGPTDHSASWRRRPAGPACRNPKSSTWRFRAPRGRFASAQATRASIGPRQLPALENLGELRHAAAFGAVDHARIFLDDSAPSGGSAVTITSAGATVAALAAAFDEHLAPACWQPRTRADYWRG